MRLSAATCDRLPPEVIGFGYDRTAITTGVVHLGLGAFARAHQIKLFDAALAGGDLRWGVLGVSLRSPTVRDALAPQDWLYTLLERGAGGEHAQLIGALTGVLVAPDNPHAVAAALAAPETHLVTLTVTEKGYKLDPATGRLIADDPDVAADLASLAAPRTVPGLLVAGLAARQAAGLPPFTAISCDNLPHNGSRLRAAVLAMARVHDPALAHWIEAAGAFPETMVDRIVPATTAAQIAGFAARTGIEDHALVGGEPFLQWVIEDRFAGLRPDLAQLGAQLTDAVGPWEEAKLRLLNGAHSAIAYLGGLAGKTFVHDFVTDAIRCAFVDRLWDESAATLSPPAGLDLAAYRAALMGRFANPALGHRTRQIAMDGSQKMPQRLLAPIAARRRAGEPIDALALAVAAWMRWQSGIDDAGHRFEVDDPLATTTAAALAAGEDPVAALLAIEAIFPPALAGDATFRQAVSRHYASLVREGALRTVDEFMKGSG
jgi:fructuronate reductase